MHYQAAQLNGSRPYISVWTTTRSRGRYNSARSSLPEERHSGSPGQRIDYDTFIDRVADRASAEKADANFYAQVVLDVVEDTVPEGEFSDVREQLPEEYEDLFELLAAEEY